MKRSRGSAGVELESVAIASSLVTMRAQRAFTSAYVDISCCKDGCFIQVPAAAVRFHGPREASLPYPISAVHASTRRPVPPRRIGPRPALRTRQRRLKRVASFEKAANDIAQYALEDIAAERRVAIPHRTDVA